MAYDANTPHVIVVSRYDGEGDMEVYEFPTWDDAYNGQDALRKQWQDEQRNMLGWCMAVLPLRKWEAMG